MNRGMASINKNGDDALDASPNVLIIRIVTSVGQDAQDGGAIKA